MTKLHVSEKSILRKIRELPDSYDHRKCRIEYDYLMNSHESSYSNFIHLREQIVHEDQPQFSCFDFSTITGIQCALWPSIYPFTSCCESIISGKESKLSSKKSFSTKVFSEIMGYALHYDLLQWQHNRAFYKIVSGAINNQHTTMATQIFTTCSRTVWPSRCIYNNKPI